MAIIRLAEKNFVNADQQPGGSPAEMAIMTRQQNMTGPLEATGSFLQRNAKPRVN